MNKHVENLEYRKHDTVNNYICYLLSILGTSFPHIKTYIDKYILILNKIDSIDVHPMIYQMIFVNFIHSCYILELCTNTEKLFNQDDINRIASVSTEVELAFDQFNSIFDRVDMIFESVENTIGYNKVCSSELYDFNIMLSKIMDEEDGSKQILPDLLHKLNVMLVYIDHLTESSINEYFIDSSSNILEKDSSLITHKLDNETELLDKVISAYNDIYTSNTRYVQKFRAFREINIDLPRFREKNPIYYWLYYFF